MTGAISAKTMENAEIRQEQLGLITGKLAALNTVFFRSVESQNSAMQETLRDQLSELEAYINGLCRRFPVSLENDNDNARSLDPEIEWIDAKAAIILEALGKGRKRPSLLERFFQAEKHHSVSQEIDQLCGAF